ncbi:hypothetical protein [Halopiger aswanensis]|uniref:Uncharacterized protein n=1 Tax=Halopiger aswanensis TaxID=148449 RepID=A0A3R7DA32_9EURY|nr:hypothetical protein [Halopiger aswanensis]RKD85227.1 hypothetical protein ATJ93_4729 [Halopiger aswanensis]
MSSYPSENSLVVNATHQILTRIRGPYNQTTAIAPTRYQEHQAGGGYDVELPLAMRLLFQYKAPKAEPNRGVRFKLDTQQITTLATREPSEVAYYACPVVDSNNQLSNALTECYFIDAQAIEAGSSQLYIPTDYPNSPVQAKFKDSSDKSGWAGDPVNYYEIPHTAVKTWDDIRNGIESRNIGMVIRRSGSTTASYDVFVDRLQDLWALHDDTLEQVRTDGGEPNENGEQRIERLVSFARFQHLQLFEESDVELPDIERHERHLRDTLEGYQTVRRPDVHGIGRAQELVAQSGSTGWNQALPLGSQS